MGWRKCWAIVTATLEEDTWAIDKMFRASGGINQANPNGSSTAVYGHYSEGGIEVGVVLRSNGSLFGGEVAGTGRIHDHPEGIRAKVFGSMLKDTPADWKGINDDTAEKFGSSLGRSRGVATLYECGHSDDPDSTVVGGRGFRIAYSPIRRAYEWIKGTSYRFMSITTSNWAKDGYSGGGNVVLDEGVIIGGESFVRIRGAKSIASIPNGLVAVAGERIKLTVAKNTGDPTEAYCTVGGTTGAGVVFVGINPLP